MGVLLINIYVARSQDYFTALEADSIQSFGEIRINGNVRLTKATFIQYFNTDNDTWESDIPTNYNQIRFSNDLGVTYSTPLSVNSLTTVPTLDQVVAAGNTTSRSAAFGGVVSNGDIQITGANTIRNTNNDLFLATPASRTIRFQPGNVEVLRLASTSVTTERPLTVRTSNVGNPVANARLVVEDFNSSVLNMLSGNAGFCAIHLGDSDDPNRGGFVYNHNGDYLAIESNNSEVARFIANGNLGLGITTPTALLHVNSISGQRSNGLTIGEGTQTGQSSLNLYTNANGNSCFIQAIEVGARFNNLTTSASNLIFSTGLTSVDEIMRITQEGRVGIGTTSPSRNLHIHSSTGTSYLQLTSSGSGVSTSDGFQLSMSTANAFLSNREAGSMIFQIGSNERMRISNTGIVGIGVNNPTHSLDISGNLRIQQTSQIQDNAADFNNGLVFKNPGTEHAFYTGYTAGGKYSVGVFNPSSNSTARLFSIGFNGFAEFFGSASFLSTVAGADPTDDTHFVTRGYANANYSGGGGGAVGTLQQVTDLGNSTTNSITVANLRLGQSDADAAIQFADNFNNGTLRINNGNTSLLNFNAANFDLRTRLSTQGLIEINRSNVGESEQLYLVNNAAPMSSETSTAVSIVGQLNDAANNNVTAGKIIFGESSDWTTTDNRDSYLAFSTRNNNVLTEKVRISNEGMLGVGNANPTRELDILSSDAQTIGRLFNNSTGEAFYHAVVMANGGDAKYQMTVSSSQDWSFGIDNSDGDKFKLAPNSDVGNNPVFTAQSDGNIGFGTNAPRNLLNIYRNSSSTLPIARLEDDGTGDASMTFSLSGVAGVSLGIDNSDGNKFKISGSGNDVGSNPYLTILTSGPSAGNIGINTITPSRLLDVSGHVNIGTGTSGFLFNERDNQILVGTDASAYYLFDGSGNTNTHPIFIGSGRMRILGNGNVGIGTTSPNSLLEINASNDNLLRLTRTNTRAWGHRINSMGSWQLYDETANADRITVDTNGRVFIRRAGTTLPTISDDTNMLLYRTNAAATTSQMSIVSGNAGFSRINFGDTDIETVGGIIYSHVPNTLTLRAFNGDRLILSSTNAQFTTTVRGLDATADNHFVTRGQLNTAISGVDLTNYVTLDGTQTITGAKTFNSNVIIANNSPILQLSDVDNTTRGRIIVNAGSMFYYSSGSNNAGSGNHLFAGNTANDDAGTFQVRHNGANRDIYHAGNSNRSDVDWTTAALTANGVVTINAIAPVFQMRDTDNTTFAQLIKSSLTTFLLSSGVNNTGSGNLLFAGANGTTDIGTFRVRHSGGNRDIYHAGNSNRSDVDWTANNVNVNEEVIINNDGTAFNGFSFQTNSNNRWRWFKSTGETGSNVGGNLILSRHADNGDNIGTVININRASGGTTFSGPVSGVDAFSDAHFVTRGYADERYATEAFVNGRPISTFSNDLNYATQTFVNTNFYTRTQLQTSGMSQVHWDNITNRPTTTMGHWTLSGNDISNNNSGNVKVTNSLLFGTPSSETVTAGANVYVSVPPNLLRSDDAFLSFETVNNIDGGTYYKATNDNNYLATTVVQGSNVQVWTSTDQGVSFARRVTISNGGSNETYNQLALSSGTWYFATRNFVTTSTENVLYRSTNQGTTWTGRQISTISSAMSVACSADGVNAIVLGYTNATGLFGLYYTTNSGNSWNQYSGLTSFVQPDISGDGNHTWILSGGTLLYGGALGSAFGTRSPSGVNVLEYRLSNTGRIVATSPTGIHYSNDNGLNWSTIPNTGATSTVAISQDGGYILARSTVSQTNTIVSRYTWNGTSYVFDSSMDVGSSTVAYDIVITGGSVNNQIFEHELKEDGNDFVIQVNNLTAININQDAEFGLRTGEYVNKILSTLQNDTEALATADAIKRYIDGITVGGGTIQSLSSTKVGTTVSVNISAGGGGTSFSVADDDNNSTNEIQMLSLNGSNLTLSNGGGTVTLPTGSGSIDYINGGSLNTATGSLSLTGVGNAGATISLANMDISLLDNDSGFITDAPNNGSLYARQNGGWTVITSGGGGGISDGNNFPSSLQWVSSSRTLTINRNQLTPLVETLTHNHPINEITGLQTALDGKANVSHTQAISTITGLQTALDGKANVSHTQAISTITGLQTALDGKANVSHTHSISDVTGLQTALNSKLNQISTYSTETSADAINDFVLFQDASASNAEKRISIQNLLMSQQLAFNRTLYAASGSTIYEVDATNGRMREIVSSPAFSVDAHYKIAWGTNDFWVLSETEDRLFRYNYNGIITANILLTTEGQPTAVFRDPQTSNNRIIFVTDTGDVRYINDGSTTHTRLAQLPNWSIDRARDIEYSLAQTAYYISTNGISIYEINLTPLPVVTERLINNTAANSISLDILGGNQWVYMRNSTIFNDLIGFYTENNWVNTFTQFIYRVANDRNAICTHSIAQTVPEGDRLYASYIRNDEGMGDEGIYSVTASTFNTLDTWTREIMGNCYFITQNSTTLYVGGAGELYLKSLQALGGWSTVGLNLLIDNNSRTQNFSGIIYSLTVQ